MTVRRFSDVVASGCARGRRVFIRADLNVPQDHGAEGGGRITDDTRIDALGLDSIATIEMVSFIEERIEVTFPDDELARVQKVADLVALVRRGGQ